MKVRACFGCKWRLWTMFPSQRHRQTKTTNNRSADAEAQHLYSRQTHMTHDKNMEQTFTDLQLLQVKALPVLTHRCRTSSRHLQLSHDMTRWQMLLFPTGHRRLWQQGALGGSESPVLYSMGFHLCQKRVDC